LLQWQDTGAGRIEGTATGAAESGTPPYASVSGSSIPLSGTISGSTVILSFTVPGLFGSAQRRVNGTLNHGALTLQITQAGGTIRDVTFVQGNTSSYNSAVAALRQEVRLANPRDRGRPASWWIGDQFRVMLESRLTNQLSGPCEPTAVVRSR